MILRWLLPYLLFVQCFADKNLHGRSSQGVLQNKAWPAGFTPDAYMCDNLPCHDHHTYLDNFEVCSPYLSECCLADKKQCEVMDDGTALCQETSTKVSASRFSATETIPASIHLLWFGGALSGKDLLRIEANLKNSNGFNTYFWSSNLYSFQTCSGGSCFVHNKAAIQTIDPRNHITIRDFDSTAEAGLMALQMTTGISLKYMMDEMFKATVYKVNAKSEDRYALLAAMSDVLRMAILSAEGGLYMDLGDSITSANLLAHFDGRLLSWAPKSVRLASIVKNGFAAKMSPCPAVMVGTKDSKFFKGIVGAIGTKWELLSSEMPGRDAHGNLKMLMFEPEAAKIWVLALAGNGKLKTFMASIQYATLDPTKDTDSGPTFLEAYESGQCEVSLRATAAQSIGMCDGLALAKKKKKKKGKRRRHGLIYVMNDIIKISSGESWTIH